MSTEWQINSLMQSKGVFILFYFFYIKSVQSEWRKIMNTRIQCPSPMFLAVTLSLLCINSKNRVWRQKIIRFKPSPNINWSFILIKCFTRTMFVSYNSHTILFQFLMGLFDHGTLSGEGGETPLHLSQLIQVAVFRLCLQLQLLLL